ncbi:hypothetical protein HPP92_006407 [Vanilla planifolia]|uniref:Uncharacterized protein n=1 Tax=Vanilla planifolia TaxID=51239 RepID=A0A835REB9_VANPL|nr:hypothetical protein HPP92_006407 [Vanilla planifolia]
MDGYGINQSSNGVSQKTNFLHSAATQISLPAKPRLNDPTMFPFLRQDPTKVAGDRPGRRTEDNEISIFDAERYFNEGNESQESASKLTTATHTAIAEKCTLSPAAGESSVSSREGFTQSYRNQSFHATPTASSEASWNSQTGLLRNPPGSVSFSVRSLSNGEQRRVQSSLKGRRLFGLGCPCSGKKSVNIEEKCSEPKTQIMPTNEPNNPPAAKAMCLKTAQVEHMAKVKILPGVRPQDPEIFRALKPFPEHEIGRRNFNSIGFSFPALPLRKEPAEPARVSIEVFRPSDGTAPPLRKSEIGNRRSFTFSGSPRMRPALEDDVESDTSSDLFEIESLSTQMANRRRDSLDDLPESRKFAVCAGGISKFRQGLEDEEVATRSIAPSECYPPSEVSVEWSVTTAEGFDRSSIANFSSAASEYDELRYAAEAIGGGKKKTVGSGGGGLLSCRSEKAVNVVRPNPASFGPATTRRNSDSVSGLSQDRLVGVARLGVGNPVHDGSGTHGRVRFA